MTQRTSGHSPSEADGPSGTADRRTVLRVGGAATLGIGSLVLPAAMVHASGGGGGGGGTPLYAVGATGPAGGRIFLTPTSPGGDNTHHYEAAPADVDAPPVTWINVSGFTSIAVDGAFGSAVGTGPANTASMLAAGDNGGSAFHADAYSLNGFSDWFLPSIQELVELANVPAIVATLGLGTEYWSSTKVDDQEAERLDSDTRIRGSQSGYGEFHNVRPVRRF